MPNIQSAKKALAQSERRRKRNNMRKKALKTAIKDFRKAAVANTDDAKERLVTVYKTADKVAKTGYIKKNTASRIKSRAAQLLKRTATK